ncbi:hypothetical protein P3S67_032225 [Capsicum chacoense]
MLKLICIVFFILYIQLYLNFIYVPKIISDVLTEVSAMEDISNKLTKFNQFIVALEEELRKIKTFKRELPFCMVLLKDAIERLKEEALQYKGKDKRLVMEELKRYNCSIRIALIAPLFTLLVLFSFFIVN